MAQIVSFTCILKNSLGNVISSTTNRDVITENPLGETEVLRGLAQGMQNLKNGEKRRIALSAADAYGFYDPKKVILYPRSRLPKGMSIQRSESLTIVSKSGVARLYRVSEIHKDMLLLDGNHPLAGQDLVFEIETLSAREATEQEIRDNETDMPWKDLH